MSYLNTWNVGLVFHLLWCSVKISYVFHPCLPFSILISCSWNTPFHRSNETPYWSSRTGDRWSWAEFLSWLNLVFCEQSLADRWLWPEFALNILWVCDVQITLAISYCLKKREDACHFYVICLHYPDTYSPQCCCGLWGPGPIGYNSPIYKSVKF